MVRWCTSADVSPAFGLWMIVSVKSINFLIIFYSTGSYHKLLISVVSREIYTRRCCYTVYTSFNCHCYTAKKQYNVLDLWWRLVSLSNIFIFCTAEDADELIGRRDGHEPYERPLIGRSDGHDEPYNRHLIGRPDGHEFPVQEGVYCVRTYLVSSELTKVMSDDYTVMPGNKSEISGWGNEQLRWQFRR